MNKLILSTAAALLLAATPGFAADLIVDEPAAVAPSDWGSLYVEFYAGARLSGTSTYYDVPTEYDMLAGPALGVSVGVGTPIPGLSAGLDVMWTSAEYDYGGEFLHTLSAMGELEYAVPLNDTFEIYGAAGLGLINITFEDSFGTTWSGSGAGYQVAVGVRANVLENVSVFAEVKHQDSFGAVDVDGDDVTSPTTNVLVGLRFAM